MHLPIIAAAGLFPSGPTLPLADIAVNLDFSLQRRHPVYTDFCGLPLCLSYFPLQESGAAFNRWATLLDALLDDLSQQTLSSPLQYQPARIWLMLPDREIFAFPAQLEEMLSGQIQRYAPLWQVKQFSYGSHALAGRVLLDIDHDRQKQTTACTDIVIALHSWVMPEALMWLEQHGLLHGSHTFYQDRLRKNAYGRVPGEGAACLVLGPASSPGWCCLSGVAVAEEKHLPGDDKPCTGAGLSQAAIQAVSQAGRPVISGLTSDFNGETYRADELGFTLLRLKHHQLLQDIQQITPALASGDTGCASLLLHLAVMAWRHGQHPEAASHTLLLSSGDDALRSAVVISPSSQGEER